MSYVALDYSNPRWLQAETRLKRRHWKRVKRGADGLGKWEHNARQLSMIHSVALEDDGNIWEHVSFGRFDETLPSWAQVRDGFRDVAGDDATGIIVIAPKAKHVDIAEVAHVWRCLTAPVLPDFTQGQGRI